MRAADTAKHISQMTGIPAKMEPRLKERNFGKYESTPRNGDTFRKDKENFVCRYEGGESMLQFCQRIYNLLDDIKNDPGGKTYLLVAHNGMSMSLISYPSTLYLRVEFFSKIFRLFKNLVSVN